MWQGRFDLVSHLIRQHNFSERAFGPGPRAKGVVDHIRKECDEVLAHPKDISEWIDIAILAFDGALREGFSPCEIAEALDAKQTKNEGRKWPDWRTADPDKAIEHVKEGDVSSAPTVEADELDEDLGDKPALLSQTP